MNISTHTQIKNIKTNSKIQIETKFNLSIFYDEPDHIFFFAVTDRCDSLTFLK